MGFRGRSIVTTWSMAAGDKASCYPASMLIVTASWAYGATVTAAAASAEDGLVATVSGARGESATTSQARRYCRTVPDGRVVPGVRAHNDDVRAHDDSCDGASRGRGHHSSIPRVGVATMAFRSVGLGIIVLTIRLSL